MDNDLSLSKSADITIADELVITQDLIQHLLEMLGEAWAEAEQLRGEIAQLNERVLAGGTPASVAQMSNAGDAEANGVLIIDDSKLLQLRLQATVQSLGYSVIGIAENGAIGAEMALKLNPRLIILDHEMPVMTGSQCLRAIRKQRADLPVIVCSGTVTEHLTQEYAQLGVTEILSKPVLLTSLIRALKRLMADGGT